MGGRGSIDTLRWFAGRRLRSIGGTVHTARRAVEVLFDQSEGGVARLGQYVRQASKLAEVERRYRGWMRTTEPGLFEAAGLREDCAINSGVSFSVVVPCFNTPDAMLKRCIESVKAQTYKNWELILCNDCSPGDSADLIARVVEGCANGDERIRLIRLNENRGISGATNACIEQGKGDYIAFLDHDDELSPFALAAMAMRIGRTQSLDLIYSDEDKIDEDGRRHSPSFKPGYSPHYLMTCNYICHLLVIRGKFLRNQLGAAPLRSEFDGAQDYDLILRATAKTDRIAHVPLVLYHWRSHNDSAAGIGGAKSFAIDAGRRAVEDFLRFKCDGKDWNGWVETSAFRLHYRTRIEVSPEARVEVVAFGGNAGNVARVLENHGRVNRVTLISGELREAMPVAILVKDDSFAEDEVFGHTDPNAFVLFVDGDLETAGATAGGFLDVMLEAAHLPKAGTVGAKILDARGRIEDAGEVADVGKKQFGQVYATASGRDPGYRWGLVQLRNVTCPAAGCFLVRKIDALRAWRKWCDDERHRRDVFTLETLAMAMRQVGLFAMTEPRAVLRRSRDGRVVHNCENEEQMIANRLIGEDGFFVANLAAVDSAYAPWRDIG